MQLRHLSVVGILLAAGPLAAAEAEHPSCRLAPELRQRLLELEPEISPCRDNGCLAVREKEARALLAEFPGQLWAARAVQIYEERAAAASASQPALLERYRQAAEASPRDATAQYLWGQLQAGSGPSGASQPADGIARALALDGAHPLARLIRARQLLLAKAPESAGNEKAAGELIAAYIDSCPARAYLSLRMVPQWPQAEFWLPQIEKLRPTLAARPPLEQAAASLLLWNAEFKLRPAAEHTALREKVAAELPRIEQLRLTAWPVYWDALRAGSEMTGGDPAAVDRRRAEFFPCENASVEIAKSDLRKKLGLPADPYQKIEPTAEQRVALLAGHRALAERCPNDPVRHVELLASLAGEPEAAGDELVAIAERTVAAMELQRGHRRSLRPLGLTSARILLDRRLGAAAALRLIEASRQDFESMRAWRMQPGAPPLNDQAKGYFAETEGLIAALEARALLQLDQKEKAAEALASSHAVLDSAAVPAGDGRQQFAEARKELLAAAPDGSLPPELAPPPAPAAAQGGLFQTVDFEFGGFPLDDPRGRPWKKVDLEGKTWLVNLWATWCGPCMAELPHIQKLHEELKDRKDVGVLTLNFDTEVGKVQPFLDRKSYTFPVLLAGKHFDSVTTDGIPQNWVVDGGLQVRRKAIGFDAEDPAGFLAGLKAELEALGKAAKPSGR